MAMQRAPGRAIAIACASLALLTGNALSQDAAASASIAAKRSAVLGYVHQLQKQKKSLVGVQVNEYEVYIDCNSADRVAELTRTRPAIIGLELMNAIAYPPYKSYLVDRALAQTAEGGLVTMSWHERNPVEVCPRGEFFDCAKKPMTAEVFRAVVSEGTPEHKLWLADVDAIAKVLEDLHDRGIVVLFRPYHEMNREWFWWGKQGDYPQLWDALYDQLAIRHKLDNLIWVWSVDRDMPDPRAFFPLRHPPDVVGIDVYEHDPDSPKYAVGRANLVSIDRSAPFALTEVGVVPSRKILDSVNPAWVLLWGGEYLNNAWALDPTCSSCNKPEQVAAFFKLDRIVTLDKIPGPLRAIFAAGVVNDLHLHQKNPSCPAKLR